MGLEKNPSKLGDIVALPLDLTIGVGKFVVGHFQRTSELWKGNTGYSLQTTEQVDGLVHEPSLRQVIRQVREERHRQTS